MKKWKFACMAIVVIAAVGLLACGDDKGSTGPSPVTFTSAPLPQVTIPTNNPTPPPPDNQGNRFTILDGAEAKFHCGNMEPGWFLPDGFTVRVRLDKFKDHEYTMASNVFWSPEIGCERYTDKPGKGSSWRRDKNQMVATFTPFKEYGRYQWDVGLKDETTDEYWPIGYGVFNTGNKECEPPPTNECKDKALDFHLETQQGDECGAIFLVKPVTDVSKPNPPTFSVVPALDSMDGAWHIYEWYIYSMKSEGFGVTFTAKNKCMTKTESVRVPPHGQCCGSSVNVTVTPVPGEECDEQQCFDATYNWSPTTTLSVSPEADNVSGNRYCFDRDEETYKVTFTASNECTSDSKPVRVTPRSPCCSTHLEHSVKTKDCTGACIATDSSTGGTVTIGGESKTFEAGKDDTCFDLEASHYSYTVKNTCESDTGRFQVDCEVCETCQDYRYSASVDGNTLVIGSSLLFTVDGKTYQPGQHNIPFRIECDGEKTVTVDVYDTSCNIREVCKSEEYTLYGEECEGCTAPELTLDVSTTPGDNETEVCFNWSASGDLSGGTLTLYSGLGDSWEVGASGDKCFNVSCESDGGHTAELIFAHDGDPECSADEDGYYKVDECEVDECELIPPNEDEFCLDSPLGNPSSECSYFFPGSDYLGKDEPGNGYASRDALLAIVKSGSSACPGQSDHGYFLFPDVEEGDSVDAPARSHVITYCGCPE